MLLVATFAATFGCASPAPQASPYTDAPGPSGSFGLTSAPPDGGCISTGGAIRWVRHLGTEADDGAGGTAVAPDGSLVTLWHDAAASVLRLDRVAASGVNGVASTSVRPSSLTRLDVLGAPGGDLYVEAGAVDSSSFPPVPVPVDLGAGPVLGQQIVRLASGGRPAELVTRCEVECGIAILAANAAGDRIVQHGDINRSGTVLVRADGVQIPLIEATLAGTTGPAAPVGCSGAAFAADGSVLCGGATRDDGPSPSLHPALVRIDRDGNVLAKLQHPGFRGTVTRVAIDANGRVVAAGSLDPAAGGTPTGFVAALEPDGSVRYAHQLPRPATAMALDANGRAAVVVGEWPRSCDELGAVGLFDATGALRWRRELPSDVAGPCLRWSPSVVFATNGDVVVSGSWSGTFDFGSGPVSSRGSDVYVLAIVP
jgi:hypothetical protein